MAKKFYGVKKGKVPGVFLSLEEAKASVDGFPSPEWRGCDTIEEATAYCSGIDLFKEKIEKDLADGFLVVFTDGSFSPIPPKYSFGIVIIEKGFKETYISQSPIHQKFLDSKNISGEIFGVIVALDWAILHEYFKVKVYYDYLGISKMFKGEWKLNAAVTRFFAELVKEKYDGIIDVSFEKVKAHTHNAYNDKADALAYEALQGKPTRAINGGTFFSIKHIAESSVSDIIKKIQDSEPEIKVLATNVQGKSVYNASFGKSKIKITFFASPNNKLLVQGKSSALFQIVISFLLELIDSDKVIDTASDYYQYSFNKTDIEALYSIHCSNIPKRYGDNLIKLLLQSIINLKSPQRSYEADYSYYVYPAYRALEGHIDYQLIDLGIPKPDDKFTMFDKDAVTSQYSLKQAFAAKIASASVDKINRCYNFFHDKRHQLFHFGEIVGSTDRTMMIENKVDGDALIEETLKLINDTVI